MQEAINFFHFPLILFHLEPPAGWSPVGGLPVHGAIGTRSPAGQSFSSGAAEGARAVFRPKGRAVPSVRRPLT